MITVIVNSYHRLNFLEAALESIYCQTDTPRYEVILVTPFDPCPYSSEFQNRFSRIGIEFTEISLGEGGTGRYLAAGASAARGEIIAVLDDDDIWAPQKLHRVSAMFSLHPDASFLHNGCCLIDEAGGLLPPWNLHRLGRHSSTLMGERREVTIVPSSRNAVRALNRFEPSFNNSSIAIRRETLRSHLPELEQISGGEDAFLYFCGVASGQPMMAISERLTYVRVHSTGSTTDIRTLATRNLERNQVCRRLTEHSGPTHLLEMLYQEQAFWELVRLATFDPALAPGAPAWIRRILRSDAVPPRLTNVLAVGLGLLGFVSPRLSRVVWSAWRAAW